MARAAFGLTGPVRQTAVGPVAQVVEIEHRDSGEGSDTCFDVAWDSDVDDVEGTRRTRSRAGRLDEFDREDVLFGAGAGNDHIGRSDRLGEPLERDRHGTDPIGESGRALGGPVRHEQVGTTGAVECDRDTLTHRSRADDEYPLAFQVADDIGDHLDGRVADRRRAPGDAGLGAGTLAGLDRAAEQQVQRRPRGTLELGGLPGRAYLTEDLALTEHRGVEPGGDLEEVGDRRGIVLAVEMRDQLVGRQVAELAQEVAYVAVRPVEQFGDDIDLGAVAGRQHDGFADVVAHRQAGNGLAESVGDHRDAFEQRQRAAAMVDPDDQ